MRNVPSFDNTSARVSRRARILQIYLFYLQLNCFLVIAEYYSIFHSWLLMLLVDHSLFPTLLEIDKLIVVVVYLG